MPTRERVQAFVALVEQAKYVEALEQFYHRDAWMQDNQQPPRLGLERLIADERATMARFATMKTDPVTDLLIDGDKVRSAGNSPSRQRRARPCDGGDHPATVVRRPDRRGTVLLRPAPDAALRNA